MESITSPALELNLPFNIPVMVAFGSGIVNANNSKKLCGGEDMGKQ